MKVTVDQLTKVGLELLCCHVPFEHAAEVETETLLKEEGLVFRHEFPNFSLEDPGVDRSADDNGLKRKQVDLLLFFQVHNGCPAELLRQELRRLSAGTVAAGIGDEGFHFFSPSAASVFYDAKGA